MPNFSGIWTVTQQMQAKGASTWPQVPGAPTIGTATAGIALCASVTFCAPACSGFPTTITAYQAISTPGCFTATGASSPLVVTGLSNGTSYTFKVRATNATGYGGLSAASNSVSPPLVGQAQYTTAGTYSYVIPACVTSISVLSVGAGRNGGSYGGGGGGALAYKNNLAVTPGQTLTVKVGCSGSNACVSDSRVTYAGTRYAIAQGGSCFYGGTWSAADGGGNGGYGGTGSNAGGGGGAAGYTGSGGNGTTVSCAGTYATAGSGGGGGGGGRWACSPSTGGGGGGVGLLGPGSNGAGGVSGRSPGTGCYPAAGGGGGSGGAQGGPAFVNPACYNLSVGGYGGAYGGGGGRSQFGTQGAGGSGAVRILYPGTARSYPSTNVGNL